MTKSPLPPPLDKSYLREKAAETEDPLEFLGTNNSSNEQIEDLSKKARQMEKERNFQEAIRIWGEIEKQASRIGWNAAQQQAQSRIDALKKKCEMAELRQMEKEKDARFNRFDKPYLYDYRFYILLGLIIGEVCFVIVFYLGLITNEWFFAIPVLASCFIGGLLVKLIEERKITIYRYVVLIGLIMTGVVFWISGVAEVSILIFMIFVCIASGVRSRRVLDFGMSNERRLPLLENTNRFL